MIAAINFNDELRGWREEVHDEAEHRHLVAKRDAELARAQRAPERSL
jgi:hypothetical protein